MPASRQSKAAAPSGITWRRIQAVTALFILVGSALALGLAPLMMPASYSWISDSTSESGAQGIEGAWLANLGFMLFGLGSI